MRTTSAGSVTSATGDASQPRRRPAARAVIAIDGPSGSGKSTVSRAVAARLGFRYLDTGALYRALTWLALREGIEPADAPAVTALAERARLEPGTDPAAPTVRVDGHDVTRSVREPYVSAAVSAVAAAPGVRAVLLGLQREIVGPGRIVVEGRDIGTTVVPDATVKVFLTASPEARATRRHAEHAPASAGRGTAVRPPEPGADIGGRTRLAEGTGADAAPPNAPDAPGGVDHTRAALLRRDALDSGRENSPLRKADDADEVDSTGLSVDEVVAAVLELCEAAGVDVPRFGGGPRGAGARAAEAVEQPR